MFSRRHVVAGGLLSIGFANGTCPCKANAARVNSARGCWISDEDVEKIYKDDTDTRFFITGDEPMIPKSGDKDFDIALAQTLAKVSDTFEVLPGFAYYDDYDGQNAYATPKNRRSQVDGTVLFGQDLLTQLRGGPDHPEISVAAVCAHEFGHILQFKHDLYDEVGAGQPTVKRPELQADYFAGYFAGIRKKLHPSFEAAVFAQTQSKFGDNKLHDPGHHGTPDERAGAIVKGFDAAYHQSKNLNDAIAESISYVKSL
jgi:hypothetical protein